MKRSTQVVLLLMGVGTVGAGAYAITPPRNNCLQPGAAPPSAVAPNPAGAPQGDPCPPRRQGSFFARSGSSSHYSSWRSGSSSSGTYGRSTSTTRTGRSSGGAVARGGFGGTGHGISSGG